MPFDVPARRFSLLTGRFTQEDPIGLAGGLNLYGFANGDPVNFTDPFGLCTPWPACWLTAAVNWIKESAEVSWDELKRGPSHQDLDALAMSLPLVGGMMAKEIAGTRTARSAISGVQLGKSLASQAQMAEAGTIIAGGETGTVFRNAARYAQQYGGRAVDWVKKTSSTYRATDGYAFQTHWVENVVTGIRMEFKTKLVP